MRNSGVLQACILLTAVLLVGCAAHATADTGVAKRAVCLVPVKLWRGVVNVVTCPLELPKQVYRETRDRGVSGPFVGLANGAGMVFHRGTGGILEICTCLNPFWGSHHPTVDPPYVWLNWGPCSSTRSPETGPPP